MQLISQNALPSKVLSTLERYKSWLPISLIFILAAGLYLNDLEGESLWMDELISIDRAKTENIDLLRARPLYYLLLHVWMQFGSGDAWLRGLNILFSLGSVLLIYILGKRLLGNAVGLGSALILTLSPLIIHHTQEVRMYAPSIFFGLLGSLVLVRALDNPKISWISLWVALRWLAIVTTYLNLLLLLPDAVIVIWKFRKQRKILYRFGVGLAVICVLWLPWVIKVVGSSARFMGGVSAPGVSVGDVNSSRTSPNAFTVIYQLSRFTAWSFGRPNSDAIYRFYQVFSFLIAGLLAFLAFTKQWRSSRLPWVAAWAFLPMVPLFLVSQISRSLWVDRYLVLTAPYLFILLAAGLVEVWRRQRLGAIAIALIYLVAVGGGLKRYYTVLDREDWRGLVGTISQNEKAGDVIVWSMNQTVPRALNHYYQGSADIEIISDGHDNPTFGENERLAAERWLSDLPKQQSRLWLAYAGSSPVFLSALEENFNVQEHRNFSGGLDLFLLTSKAVAEN